MTLDRWLKRCLKTTRARARKASIPFDIDFDYLKSIWTGICPVFLIDLTFDREKITKSQASLDRIVPDLGYTKNNVAFLSFFANAIKQDASAEEIFKVAYWLKNQVP